MYTRTTKRSRTTSVGNVLLLGLKFDGTNRFALKTKNWFTPPPPPTRTTTFRKQQAYNIFHWNKTDINNYIKQIILAPSNVYLNSVYDINILATTKYKKPTSLCPIMMMIVYNQCCTFILHCMFETCGL